MSVLLQIFEEAREGNAEIVTDSPQLDDDFMDPLVVWKLLLDKNSADIGGFKEQNRERNRTFHVNDIRKIFSKTVKFIFRFGGTMGVLYISAIVFAYLEDSASLDVCSANTDLNVSTSISNRSSSKYTSFRSYLRSMDNINFTECDLDHLTWYVENVKQQRIEVAKKTDGFDHLKVQKWFYFVIIATTTIGYGDVCPKTDNGKIFYCCFSVIGIVLMMSLLKSCGAVLNEINKRFHQSVRHFLCPGSTKLSDEFLSIITMIVLFLVYLSIGIAHDSADTNEEHSLIDIIYFWIVSLTTVGFGDISHSLEFEIKHAYELTVYRVFGLSMVAGIIESILDYIAFQKETLRNKKIEEKLEAMQRKIIEKLQSALTGSQFHSKNESHGLADALKQVAMFSMSTLGREEET